MSSDAALRRSQPAWLWAVIPLVMLALLVWLFLTADPLRPLGVSAPPIEELTFERVVLDESGIHLHVRAAGSEPLEIAQVQVDGAYWAFELEPPGPLPRLETATIHVPYPWVQDETHHITAISSSGVAFEHTVDVATPTPRFTLTRLLAFALLGIYVGVVPVALGLLFYPYLRTLGQRGVHFLLSLTVGLLVFLLVDTMMEGLELAAGAAGALQPVVLVWMAAGLSFLALFAVGRRSGSAPRGLSLATYLALGIGLHNLGEGMAIGAAFAIGEAAFGSFLVVGFTLHNITEGIGIAAPLTERKTRFLAFVGLAALAGLPAVAGTWFGAFAFSPHWAALFLGIGAGAILQVIVEVGAYLSRSARQSGMEWFSARNLAGFAAGIFVMYGTALLLSA